MRFCTLYHERAARFQGGHSPCTACRANINIDGTTGATTIETSEPAPRQTTVRETTVERTTRS